MSLCKETEHILMLPKYSTCTYLFVRHLSKTVPPLGFVSWMCYWSFKVQRVLQMKEKMNPL